MNPNGDQVLHPFRERTEQKDWIKRLGHNVERSSLGDTQKNNTKNNNVRMDPNGDQILHRFRERTEQQDCITGL